MTRIGAVLCVWLGLVGVAGGQTTVTRTDRLVLTNPPAKSSETACLWRDGTSGMIAVGTCATGDITGVSFTLPSIFGAVSACTAGDCAFTFSLANQTEYLVFARGSGTGVPSFQSLAKGHLPSAVAYEDEANTYSAMQTFNAGGTFSTPNSIDEGVTGTERIALGMGPDTGRVVFEDGSTVWEIDNSSGTFRWYQPKQNPRMTLTSSKLFTAGTFDVRGAISDGAGNLELNDAVDISGITTFANTAQSSGWTSRTSGWGMDAAGALDAQYGFFKEFHAQTFTAELTQAVNGSMTWTKSVTELAGESTVGGAVTCPTAGGGAETWWFRDAPSGANLRIFQTGDYLAIRVLSWADGDTNGASELTVSDCIVSVASYADGTAGNDGYQSWAVTRPATGGGAMANSGAVPLKSQVLDFGATGDGFLFATVSDGANNANAPYFGAATWATTPAATNWTTRARLGQLRGITSTDEYGLLAGTYGAGPSSCIGASSCAAVQFFRASDQNFDLHGIDFTLWDANSANIILRRNSGNPYLAIGNAAPTSYASGAGIWMGSDAGTYKARIGDPSGNRLAWDGSNLTVVGTITASASSNVYTEGEADTLLNAKVNTSLSNAPAGILNSSVSINANGTLSGAGSGQVTPAGIGASDTSLSNVLDATVRTKTGWGHASNATLIDGGDIYTGSIYADSIAANQITATKIASDAIDGKTITGATIRTADSTSRLEMNGTDFKLWRSGTNIFAIDTDGLTVFPPTGGAISTNHGYRFENSSSWGLYAWSGSSGASRTSTVITSGATNAYSILSAAGSSGASAQVRASGTGNNATLDLWAMPYAGGTGEIVMRGAVRPYDNAAYSLGDTSYRFAGGWFSGNVTAAGLYLTNWTGAGASDVCADYGAGSAGYLLKCSSSRRYKERIVPAVAEWGRVLDIVPSRFWWIGKPEIGEDFGAIAEDVAALGLSDLVTTDEDGQPEGVRYNRIALYLIPIIKQQQAQIAALEARVAALEAKR